MGKVTLKSILQFYGFKSDTDLVLLVSILRAKNFFSEAQSTLENELEIEFCNWVYGLEVIFKFSEQCFLSSNSNINPVASSLINSSRADKQLLPYHLMQAYSGYGQSNWPTGKCSTIVLFSHMESILIKRLALIPKTNDIYTIYCLTSPRGLFNEEMATAEILAKWFNMPEKIPALKALLSKYANRDHYKQWHANLPALKVEILQLCNLSTWPKVPSFYYKHKAIYDAYADRMGHAHLDCLGGAWPVALDLIDYHLANWRIKANLVPVLTLPHSSKMVGITECLDNWLKYRGLQLLKHCRSIVFLGIDHGNFIDAINTSLISASKAYDYLFFNKIKNYFGGACHAIIHYIGCNDNDVEKYFLPALAKNIYLRWIQKKYFLDLIDIKYRHQEIVPKLMEKMCHFHSNKYYIAEAHQVFKLAQYFAGHKPITAIGLLMYGKNILAYHHAAKYFNDEINNQLFKLFLQLQKNKNFTITANDIAQLKNKLVVKRWQMWIILQHYAANDMGYCQLFIQKNMFSFFQEIIILAKLNNHLNSDSFAWILLGSYGRNNASPYSDIESLLIIADDGYKPLALKFVKDVLAIIISLGETILLSLGIKITDAQGHKYDFSGRIFDFFTAQGIAFDRNIAGGQKTPLGGCGSNQKKYQLCGTIHEILTDYAHPDGQCYSLYLPQLLQSSKLVAGNQGVFACYQSQLIFLKQQKYYRQYALKLLAIDCENFLKTLSNNNVIIEHKNFFYRPIISLIENLLLFFPTNAYYLEKKLYLLHRYGLPFEMYETLTKALKSVNYLRWQQHFYYGEQKTFFPSTNKHFIAIKKSSIACCTFFNNYFTRYNVKQLIQENTLMKSYLGNVK